ncbi:precorrin-3B synthase [Dactylosporangium vinaceum]|uniref:Precorrin-3B synthase n=1 Tax=Dactylosporangium vinaceum TaxID=53362 RepID=A0ABV5MG86_9ACTN|nr:precorrin-3B synthase [Dactylosporangium vinaceum]UAB98997.1 precorrin-3B synthase [Dactylosporangium vinaceum]
MQPATRRESADRCPGAVQVHPAADGGLARVRLPGGRITGAQLAVLRTAAAELADPALELTSRGNVQVRALPPGAEHELAARLTSAGLLPSATHERVRNIVATPLSAAVRPLVARFDALLCAEPALAALPGRFLATIDDGRGDVTPLLGDVGLHDSHLTLAGVLTEARGHPELLVRAAGAFLAERAAQHSNAWRLAELVDGPQRVAARLGTRLTALAPNRTDPPGPGIHGDSAVLAVPLGLLTAPQSAALSALGEIIVTPWRTVVVPAAAMADAVESGLVADPASPWAGVTACAGRPGCAKSLADVRADARAAVAAGTAEPAHWVGCERRCGAPKGRHVEMLATPAGYERSVVA